MATITLNGVDALTESGGTVTVAAGTNLVLGTGAVPTSAIADDAVTGAKIENNPTIAGNLTVAGTSTLTGAVTVAGTLTVEGATTTVESVTLTVDDKNIEMGSVDTPTDTTADGGGLTLKGATDKTMSWVNADDAWTFNQHLFPSADGTQNLGSATKRWNNIHTTDLHLANDRGNWTVIEEEDYLTLRNNKTNKVYKLVMEEIE